MPKESFENYVHPQDENFVFTFGKHKGKTVGDVMAINPSYLLWAHDNIEWFKLKESIVEKAFNKSLEIDDFEYGDETDDYYGFSMWDFI